MAGRRPPISKTSFSTRLSACSRRKTTNEKGANAAWDAGRFLKQITLIQIVGADNQLKFVSQDIVDEYLALVNAAAADGVLLPLKSGFEPIQNRHFFAKAGNGAGRDLTWPRSLAFQIIRMDLLTTSRLAAMKEIRSTTG